MSRPAFIYSNIRGRFLFLISHYILKIPGFLSGRILLKNNVRVQNITSLMAEKPSAEIQIDDYCIIYEDAQIAAFGHGKIHIGAHSIIGRAQIFSRSSIEIGSSVVTSWNVFIQDYDAHPISSELRANQIELMTRQFSPHFNVNQGQNTDLIMKLSEKMKSWSPESLPIRIGNSVWIGANVSILKGAQIGDGCIIAANAVVTEGIYPPNCLLAGVPAKVVKTLN